MKSYFFPDTDRKVGDYTLREISSAFNACMKSQADDTNVDLNDDDADFLQNLAHDSVKILSDKFISTFYAMRDSERDAAFVAEQEPKAREAARQRDAFIEWAESVNAPLPLVFLVGGYLVDYAIHAMNDDDQPSEAPDNITRSTPEEFMKVLEAALRSRGAAGVSEVLGTPVNVTTENDLDRY